MHGTYPPERSNAAGFFPDRMAIIGLVGALVKQHDEWAVSCRYRTVAKLSAMSHDPGTAAMTAAQRTNGINDDEAGEHQFLNPVAGHCRKHKGVGAVLWAMSINFDPDAPRRQWPSKHGHKRRPGTELLTGASCHLPA